MTLGSHPPTSVTPEFIDSHCHLDLISARSVEQTITQAQQLGVQQFIVPGLSLEQWPTAQLLGEAYPDVHWAAGIHPWWLASVTDQASARQQLLAWAEKPGCVAVGETGLDLHKSIPIGQQMEWLDIHFQVAIDVDKPLIVHNVKAHNPLQALIARYQGQVRGVIHGFSGSLDLAQWYWQRGFYLGVGGVITYPRAKKTRASLAAMPLQALLLETDSPDMPLMGQQGRENSPANITTIARSLAQLRAQTIDEVARATSANTRQLFNLPKRNL